MKHASNPRRGRGRNSGRRNQNSRNRNFESTGPEAKVRGTAQQVLDKYLALARDAHSAGDRIAYEGYMQHAEHYYRILNPEGGSEEAQGGNQNTHQPRHNDRQQRHAPSRHQTGSSPETNEEKPVSNSSSKPVAEVVETPAPEPAVKTDEVVEEKPRRRGRPRKIVAEETTEKTSEESGDKATEESAA